VLSLSALTMPPFAGVDGVKAVGSTIIACTKTNFSPQHYRSAHSDRRQFSKSEREIPRRRAIQAIIRDVSTLPLDDLELLAVRSTGRLEQLVRLE
jgi:hypothetical protein